MKPMHKKYIPRLIALRDYIVHSQNPSSIFKQREIKSGTDFMKNILNASQRKYHNNIITKDILLKYNNIKTEIEHDYPEISNDLSKSNTDSIVIYEIDYLLNIFKNMPEIPNISLRKEGIFLDGQEFDAFLFIGEIIFDADINIRLIDNFINDDVLTTLSSKKSKDVEVKILTRNRKNNNSIKIALKKFGKQYQDIQIRTSDNFHDRFVFIDEKYIYHLGCSIKDAGGRTFMFSRIEDPDIIGILNKKWNDEWAKDRSI
jgi:hypothetical protein